MMGLILVSGAIANKPLQGGEAWVRLSWLCGLRQLGFRVHFIEQIALGACVDAAGRPARFEESINRAYFDQVMRDFGLAECASLICVKGESALAMDSALPDLVASADALVNISGNLMLPRLLGAVPRRVFIDIDPGFTQFWHASGNAGANLAGHNVYYTIGRNIGEPYCPIPTCGIDWRKIVPPVVLEDWPVCDASVPMRFTTIANWRGAYGTLQFGGTTYGLKVHEFRKVMGLPGRVSGTMEIALNIHPGDAGDRQSLLDHRWTLANPVEAAGTPQQFRRYVQDSAAEFSVAQGIYVQTRSGWFSDRTACYLASGRPAVVQDTCLARRLPVGWGLLTFSTQEEAVAAVESVANHYTAHAAAARAIAEEHFDSDKVLGRFVDEIGVRP